jgi:predicted nucleic acid-binding protein
MITYTLDSNIVSYYLKNHADLVERVDAEVKNNGIAISPIVYYEINNWLLKNNSKKKAAIFEKICSDKGIGIIDKNALDIASAIFIKLQRNGIKIDDTDILIAAWCIQNGCTLVTNNLKHFDNIENLKVTNWI